MSENDAECSNRECGMLGIVYVLSQFDDPLTVTEIHNESPFDVSKSSISGAATRAYRADYVKRSKRDTNGFGSDPYEYQIAPIEEGGD